MTFVDGTTTELTVADLFERQDVMGNMIMTSAGLGAPRRPGDGRRACS